MKNQRRYSYRIWRRDGSLAISGMLTTGLKPRDIRILLAIENSAQLSNVEIQRIKR